MINMEWAVLVSIISFTVSWKHRPWRIYEAVLRVLPFRRTSARTPTTTRENRTMGKIMALLKNVLLTIDNIFRDNCNHFVFIKNNIYHSHDFPLSFNLIYITITLPLWLLYELAHGYRLLPCWTDYLVQFLSWSWVSRVCSSSSFYRWLQFMMFSLCD